MKYFSVQRCNAPNAPKISILIFRICIKLNLGFILAILWYFWHYTSEGVMGPPHTPKIEILKWPSSVPAQYKFILWYKLSFLWKFQPDWPTLRGVLGWSGILWLPRQLHSLNLHFGLDMNFSKNKLLKFISGATPVGNNMVFNLESTLIENISAFPYTAICDCIFAFLDHIWHIRHHWYIRCNPKTYAIRFSVWQAIFGPNFRLIDQHLVLVWLIYIYFGYFTTIFGWNIFCSEM